MRNSLIFKLMGAFLLVIAIGALVISVLTSLATRNAFNLYTTRSGQIWAQQLAPQLADYYTQKQSWQGVDVVIQDIIGQFPHNGTGTMMGQGRGPGAGGQFAGGGMMAGMYSMGERLFLADAQGIVVIDTQNELTGQQIPSTQLKNGAPILVDNQLVGTIIVTPNNIATSGTLAGEFLASVNQAIVSSVVAAGILALILGAILSFQITAPLRQLKKAASAIAHGDLSQRVKISSRDELGELGQTFNHMAESLANAETQRQHLVADVAHELRTPLAAIQGTLEGMQDGVLPLDAEQIATLHSETILLNRLVGDLRLLSLAEAGQLKLERQETEPSGFIQQVVERAKSQANQRNIRLETDVPAKLPDIWIDSDRITQVLNNLISNALRYTPEGGTITIRATFPPGEGSLRVSVADTGAGIDPENLPYVFDRFYRADKSRTRSSGGSGLGLAIVKQLVEAHGGSVLAESPIFQGENQEGFGTKISFTLPILKSDS
jgi:signal transduction histidine kinase